MHDTTNTVTVLTNEYVDQWPIPILLFEILGRFSEYVQITQVQLLRYGNLSGKSYMMCDSLVRGNDTSCRTHVNNTYTCEDESIETEDTDLIYWDKCHKNGSVRKMCPSDEFSFMCASEYSGNAGKDYGCFDTAEKCHDDYFRGLRDCPDGSSLYFDWCDDYSTHNVTDFVNETGISQVKYGNYFITLFADEQHKHFTRDFRDESWRVIVTIDYKQIQEDEGLTSFEDTMHL
eukprot:UN33341